MMSARDAMQQAIERAQLADWEGARVFLAIATELRLGSPPVAASGPGKGYEPEPGPIELAPDGQLAYGRTFDGFAPGGTVQVPAPEPAFRRAETEVLQRIPSERTPAYDAAGDSLGETRSIPARIAHPQSDSVGTSSTCVYPECGLPVVWIKNRGWVHDVPSHTASCDKAAGDVAVNDA